MIAIIIVAVVATAVGAYLFLRNNPQKKAKLDSVVDRIASRL